MGKLVTNVALLTMISTSAIAMAKAAHLGAALASGLVHVLL